jgi:hypothetical protein
VGIGFVKVKLIHGLKIKAAEFFAFFQEGLGLFGCQKERVVFVEGFLGIQFERSMCNNASMARRRCAGQISLSNKL